MGEMGADDIEVLSVRERATVAPVIDQGGFTSTVSLISMAVGLLLVAVLLVFSLGQFGGGTTTGSAPAKLSILSSSAAESQLKLCSEGRDSTYGDPPTSAQQAKCVRALLGQVSGGGPTGLGSP
jgi:hypothetical protein